MTVTVLGNASMPTQWQQGLTGNGENVWNNLVFELRDLFSPKEYRVSLGQLFKLFSNPLGFKFVLCAFCGVVGVVWCGVVCCATLLFRWKSVESCESVQNEFGTAVITEKGRVGTQQTTE